MWVVVLSVVVGPVTSGGGLGLAGLLVVLGGAGIFGNLLAGRCADRFGGRPVVTGALLGLLVLFLFVPVWSASVPMAVLGVAVYGLIGFGVSAPQTYRLLRLGDQASLAVALNGAALYLAISASGLVGAAVLTTLGVGWLGACAAGLALVAAVLSEGAQRAAVA